uniref:Uncharacterized protein n=1 Tax=Avena sativa TaxID=4498 RepID=A0ACD5XT17_AVESA
MPSSNHSESSQDSLLSDFAEHHGLSPRKPIPETIFDQEYTGYDDCDLRCKHDMPMYRYVCFDQYNDRENTGRRFLACGNKDEAMCDKVDWVDRPWPATLKNSLLKLWGMYDFESESRMHGNVEYATKNFQLVSEKRELERKNMELHKQLGKALEYVADLSNHDYELEVSKREKAEQLVASLEEENKKLHTQLAKRPKANEDYAALKEEKKKLEHYVADLLKLSHDQKDKMKKIVQICGE